MSSRGRCSRLITAIPRATVPPSPQGSVSGVCTHGAGLLVRCPPYLPGSVIPSPFTLPAHVPSRLRGCWEMSKEERKQGSWGSGSNRDLQLVRSACPQWRLKYCQLDKNAQHESCELSFIWGQNEDGSLGDSTSDSCEKTAPKVGEKDCL